jgi:hypothetical protein
MIVERRTSSWVSTRRTTAARIAPSNMASISAPIPNQVDAGSDAPTSTIPVTPNTASTTIQRRCRPTPVAANPAPSASRFAEAPATVGHTSSERPDSRKNSSAPK